MKKFLLLFLLPAFAQAQNPLLHQTNDPVPFQRLSATLIREATASIISTASKRVAEMENIKPEKVTCKNLLATYDNMHTDLKELDAQLFLLTETHPDSEVRRAADSSRQIYDKFVNEAILLNRRLYTIFQKCETTLAGCNDEEKRFYNRILSEFQRAGINLSQDKQAKTKKLKADVLRWAQTFDRVLTDHRDSLVATEGNMADLPALLKKQSTRGGHFVLNVTRTATDDVLTYSKDSLFRKAMWVKFNNRAYPKNIAVLDSLLYYRNLLATTLGYRSFADYSIQNKMAKSRDAVWAFEKNLANILRSPMKNEMASLARMKHLETEVGSDVQPWDVMFYKNLQIQKDFSLNSNELKEYFELTAVLHGVFAVYQKLYGIEIKESTKYPVWHSTVMAFEVFDNNQKIGLFYLDLFPRQGKYGHFECLPLRWKRTVNGKELLPMVAMVCNFAEPAKDIPSLLTLSQVKMMFHEFGHLIHTIFKDTPITSQSWNITTDFVEAPSMLMENWVMDYDVLKLFAKHYKTGQNIPRELFDKMRQAQYVGAVGDAVRRAYSSVVDLTLHDRYDSIRSTPLSEVWISAKKRYNMPVTSDDHFITGFTHLGVFPANYYSYNWSSVFAADIFTVFQRDGLLNPAVGKRYRDLILAPGASRDEHEMVKNFLEREPNSNAFLTSLGLK